MINLSERARLAVVGSIPKTHPNYHNLLCDVELQIKRASDQMVEDRTYALEKKVSQLRRVRQTFHEQIEALKAEVSDAVEDVVRQKEAMASCEEEIKDLKEEKRMLESALAEEQEE